MLKFHGTKNPAYFDLCVKEGFIESKGKGPSTGSLGLSDFYEDISLQDYKNFKGLDYLVKPKNLINLNQMRKIMNKSHSTVRSMIDNKFLIPVAKGYVNGVVDLYQKKDKKELIIIYKKYRKFILNKQSRYKKSS